VRPLRSRFLPAVILLAVFTGRAAATNAPSIDGTTSESWVLANGMRVTACNVPGADAVAIVVAYPIGRDHDPEGREGLTELMAEVAFTAAAGDLPARTHADLDRIRPAGWNVQVERGRTEFAEIADPDRFPGVLHEVATRMRGVTVTDTDVERARATQVEHRREVVHGDPGAQLYLQAGALMAGMQQTGFDRWMNVSGLDKLRARDLAGRIANVYVPVNAVLSLAGDFSGINLHAFVENEFGDIPAGTALAPAAARPGPSTRALTLHRGDLPRAVGVVGVPAPALSDTTHPSFFLSVLMLGTFASAHWGRPDGALHSRFQFSILDDPALARFYPPVLARSWTPENLRTQLGALVTDFDSRAIEMNDVLRVEQGVLWLLGGPLPGALAQRVKTDRAVLYRLCSAAAARELLGSEAFWSEYRRRFSPENNPGFTPWRDYFNDPSRFIGIVYEPGMR
jgi:predicted Zn-dependent peptidase